MSPDSYPDMNGVLETRRNNGHWQLMWKHSHEQFWLCVYVCLYVRRGSSDFATETR